MTSFATCIIFFLLYYYLQHTLHNNVQKKYVNYFLRLELNEYWERLTRTVWQKVIYCIGKWKSWCGENACPAKHRVRQDDGGIRRQCQARLRRWWIARTRTRRRWRLNRGLRRCRRWNRVFHHVSGTAVMRFVCPVTR